MKDSYTSKEVEEISDWITGKYESRMIRKVQFSFMPRIKHQIFMRVDNKELDSLLRNEGLDLNLGLENFRQQPEDMQIKVNDVIERYLNQESEKYLLQHVTEPAHVCGALDVFKVNCTVGKVKKPFPIGNYHGQSYAIYYDAALGFLKGYKKLLEQIKKFSGIKAVDDVAERYKRDVGMLEEHLEDILDRRTKKYLCWPKEGLLDSKDR